MTILMGMFMGGVIGVVLALPGLVQEWRTPNRHLPLVVDVHWFTGHRVERSHLILASLLFHLALAVLFGGLYPFLVQFGLISGYAWPMILLYSVEFYLWVGVVLLPLLGMGWFGRKEDRWEWAELFTIFIVMGLCYGAGVRWIAL